MAAYTLAKIALIGTGPALLSIPNVTIQTTIGIVLFVVIARVLTRHISPLHADGRR